MGVRKKGRELFEKWKKWPLAGRAASVVAALFVVCAIAVPGESQEGAQETEQEPQVAVEAVETAQEEAVETAEQEAPEGTLTVHYIDVGQGDSEFLELPTGETMLIDAGTASEGQTVVSYVRSLGYSSIDYVVATHPHADHIGGMPAVFAAFDVGEVWAPETTHDTQVFESFLDAVDAEGLSINVATAGSQIASGNEMDIEVLSPADGASYSDLNDWSAVVLLTFGDESFLFAGDASASVVSAANAGDIDVLKVGHHGSSTSTTVSLVNALSPDYAVISCGAGSSYGHPAESTLAALSSVEVYRTDTDGTVIATSDGSSVSWQTGATAPRQQVEETQEETATEQTQETETVQEVETAQETETAQEAEPAQSAEAADDQDSGVTVYITNTGEKYHLDGCSSLSKSKISTSLESAKSRGYEPCKRCNPPS